MNNFYEEFKNLSIDGLNEKLCKACDNGEFDKVKYLLSSPELREHTDLHYQDDYVFNCACNNGNLDIIKYLISSTELKERINIQDKPEVAFEIACTRGAVDILEYFIFELNIEKTPNIQQYFDFIDKTSNNVNSQNFINTVKNMFALRELNQNLKEELNSNNINILEQKKPKI